MSDNYEFIRSLQAYNHIYDDLHWAEHSYINKNYTGAVMRLRRAADRFAATYLTQCGVSVDSSQTLSDYLRYPELNKYKKLHASINFLRVIGNAAEHENNSLNWESKTEQEKRKLALEGLKRAHGIFSFVGQIKGTPYREPEIIKAPQPNRHLDNPDNWLTPKQFGKRFHLGERRVHSALRSLEDAARDLIREGTAYGKQQIFIHLDLADQIFQTLGLPRNIRTCDDATPKDIFKYVRHNSREYLTIQDVLKGFEEQIRSNLPTALPDGTLIGAEVKRSKNGQPTIVIPKDRIPDLLRFVGVQIILEKTDDWYGLKDIKYRLSFPEKDLGALSLLFAKLSKSKRDGHRPRIGKKPVRFEFKRVGTQPVPSIHVSELDTIAAHFNTSFQRLDDEWTVLDEAATTLHASEANLRKFIMRHVPKDWNVSQDVVITPEEGINIKIGIRLRMHNTRAARVLCIAAEDLPDLNLAYRTYGVVKRNDKAERAADLSLQLITA